MERGDVVEFVRKKRITDNDFPPPLYVGGKKNNFGKRTGKRFEKAKKEKSQ